MPAVFGIGELFDGGVGGRLVHAVADHDRARCRPWSPGGGSTRVRPARRRSRRPAIRIRPPSRKRNAQIRACRTPNLSATKPRKNMDRVIPAVSTPTMSPAGTSGLGTPLEDEVREVDGQVAEHAEVGGSLENVGQIDAPQRPRGVDQIDEGLDDLHERVRRGIGGCGFSHASSSSGKVGSLYMGVEMA